MGYYIEGPSLGKDCFIVDNHGGEIIPKPKSYNDIPVDKALICVVNNAIFDAAGYCFSQGEFEAFNVPSDFRHKTWLLMDKAKAEELSGYEKKEII